MDKRLIAGIAALGGIAAGMLAGPVVVQASAASAEASPSALADRIAIEDLIVGYYAHLGGTSAEAFGDYFTADGVFEVNGDIYRGREAIVGLYDSMGGGVSEGPQGMFHMVLTNPVIEVQGDTATASVLWTGVVNPADATRPPVVREQGREYDLLVKQNGRWRIKKRVVIADSGLPPSMLDSWQRKAGYAITAE